VVGLQHPEPEWEELEQECRMETPMRRIRRPAARQRAYRIQNETMSLAGQARLAVWTLTDRLAPNSRGVFGLAGISLSAGTAAPQPSAIINSAGKDLHLDNGTQLLLVTRPAATPEAAAH